MATATASVGTIPDTASEGFCRSVTPSPPSSPPRRASWLLNHPQRPTWHDTTPVLNHEQGAIQSLERSELGTGHDSPPSSPLPLSFRKDTMARDEDLAEQHQHEVLGSEYLDQHERQDQRPRSRAEDPRPRSAVSSRSSSTLSSPANQHLDTPRSKRTSIVNRPSPSPAKAELHSRPRFSLSTVIQTRPAVYTIPPTTASQGQAAIEQARSSSPKMTTKPQRPQRSKDSNASRAKSLSTAVEPTLKLSTKISCRSPTTITTTTTTTTRRVASTTITMNRDNNPSGRKPTTKTVFNRKERPSKTNATSTDDKKRSTREALEATRVNLPADHTTAPLLPALAMEKPGKSRASNTGKDTASRSQERQLLSETPASLPACPHSPPQSPPQSSPLSLPPLALSLPPASRTLTSSPSSTEPDQQSHPIVEIQDPSVGRLPDSDRLHCLSLELRPSDNLSAYSYPSPATPSFKECSTGGGSEKAIDIGASLSTRVSPKNDPASPIGTLVKATSLIGDAPPTRVSPVRNPFQRRRVMPRMPAQHKSAGWSDPCHPNVPKACKDTISTLPSTKDQTAHHNAEPVTTANPPTKRTSVIEAMGLGMIKDPLTKARDPVVMMTLLARMKERRMTLDMKRPTTAHPRDYDNDEHDDHDDQREHDHDSSNDRNVKATHDNNLNTTIDDGSRPELNCHTLSSKSSVSPTISFQEKQAFLKTQEQRRYSLRRNSHSKRFLHTFQSHDEVHTPLEPWTYSKLSNQESPPTYRVEIFQPASCAPRTAATAISSPNGQLGFQEYSPSISSASSPTLSRPPLVPCISSWSSRASLCQSPVDNASIGCPFSLPPPPAHRAQSMSPTIAPFSPGLYPTAFGPPPMRRSSSQTQMRSLAIPTSKPLLRHGSFDGDSARTMHGHLHAHSQHFGCQHDYGFCSSIYPNDEEYRRQPLRSQSPKSAPSPRHAPSRTLSSTRSHDCSAQPLGQERWVGPMSFDRIPSQENRCSTPLYPSHRALRASSSCCSITTLDWEQESTQEKGIPPEADLSILTKRVANMQLMDSVCPNFLQWAPRETPFSQRKDIAARGRIDSSSALHIQQFLDYLANQVDIEVEHPVAGSKYGRGQNPRRDRHGSEQDEKGKIEKWPGLYGSLLRDWIERLDSVADWVYSDHPGLKRAVNKIRWQHSAVLL